MRDSRHPEYGVITLVFGVGMGFANTALLIAVQTSVDWSERGIATASTMFFRTMGGAIAVGVDNRPSGPGLLAALIDGLTACGIDVIDICVVPTPLNYWALHNLPVVGGIQITGSHNPPEYNGFKLSLEKGTLHGDDIQELYALTQKPVEVDGAPLSAN